MLILYNYDLLQVSNFIISQSRNSRNVVKLSVIGCDHKPARNFTKLTPRDAIGHAHGKVMKQEFSTYQA